MKKLTFVLLLMMLLASAIGCDRVASVQPIGVATTTDSDGINFPVSTIEATSAVKIVNTATATVQSKDVETDVPAVQNTDVSPTATAISTAVTVQPSATAVVTVAPVFPTATPKASLVLPATYSLNNGEWAVCIARRYNLDLDALFALNKINMQTNYLPAGYVLKIPTGTTWSAKYGTRFWHTHPDTYLVKADDNINKIACYFGDVFPADIEKANGLAGKYVLTAGQKLTIP